MLKKILLRINIRSLGHMTDIILLNIAIILSYNLRFGNLAGVFHNLSQIALVIFLNLTWIIIVYIIEPYKENRSGYNITTLIYKLLVTLLVHVGVLSFFWMILKDHSYSRLRLLYFYLLFFCLASCVRILGVYILREFRKRGYFQRTYIVIGSEKTNRKIKEYFTNHPELGYSCLGTYEVKKEWSTFFLPDKALPPSLHSIYCELEMTSLVYWETIAAKIKSTGSRLKIVADFSAFIQKEVTIEYHDYLPILTISNTDFGNKYELWLKRGFDIGFSLVAFILGAPLFVFLFLGTLLSSRGPAIYTSERIGRHGKLFSIYKFRSMVSNADEIALKELGGDFHSRGERDPRITPWGLIMRKTRLDELPQFWNVLKGDMSIVGPRPLPKYDVDMLIQSSEDKFHRILMMKPGLTSLGQIRIGYATNQQENLLRMNVDLLYHRKFSLISDLWLILQTAKLMLNAKGR